MERLAIRYYRFVVPAQPDGRFREGRALELQIEGKTAGMFGELAANLMPPRMTSAVYFAQMEVTALLNAASHVSKSCKALPQFPGTVRDIAFTAPAELESGAVLEFLRRSKVANLESVRLFDIFVDDALKKAGRKSRAYSLNFRNRERTLKDAEVNAAMDKVRSRLVAEFNVELR